MQIEEEGEKDVKKAGNRERKIDFIINAKRIAALMLPGPKPGNKEDLHVLTHRNGCRGDKNPFDL